MRICFFFFFNDTATTEIYTLSLHDALPIYHEEDEGPHAIGEEEMGDLFFCIPEDRKSTRLNSSHLVISYAVFCLKNKRLNIITAPGGPRTSTRHDRKHTAHTLPRPRHRAQD